jgi:hypothetical protein
MACIVVRRGTDLLHLVLALILAIVLVCPGELAAAATTQAPGAAPTENPASL